LKITRLKITRREFALGSLALGTAVLALGGAFVRPALADDPPLADLMAPNPLGEMAIGDAKAPITVIEYASMTCPHCAHFSETTFPELKKRYIDTGKVRFMFREFPLDQLAAAGTIRGNTLVWHAGMAGWEPYNAVRGPDATGGALGFCSQCSTSQPFSEMVRFGDAWVCAAGALAGTAGLSSA